MIPWLYEIFAYNEHDTEPDYKGIVLAPNEDEAHKKVERYYINTHAGETPAHVNIHETII